MLAGAGTGAIWRSTGTLNIRAPRRQSTNCIHAEILLSSSRCETYDHGQRPHDRWRSCLDLSQALHRLILNITLFDLPRQTR